MPHGEMCGDFMPFYKDGVFYFHYTGFCEGNAGEEGKNVQVVLRAISRDMKCWEKDKKVLYADHGGRKRRRPPEKGLYCGLYFRRYGKLGALQDALCAPYFHHS